MNGVTDVLLLDGVGVGVGDTVLNSSLTCCLASQPLGARFLLIHVLVVYYYRYAFHLNSFFFSFSSLKILLFQLYVHVGESDCGDGVG